VLSWVLQGGWNGYGTCPILIDWIQWYALFYIAAFHFLRPCIELLTPKLPTGAIWGWVTLAGSVGIGLSMAAFHYPNTVLEDGTKLSNAPLEWSMSLLQPVLLACAMCHFPLDMKWWGNTTLGCYCFHFYFLPKMMHWGFENVQSIGEFDPSGFLVLLYVVGTAVAYTTLLGPVGHMVLIGPNLVWEKCRKRRA
jgi:hypothetical protein